jgi:MFS family permease
MEAVASEDSALLDGGRAQKDSIYEPDAAPGAAPAPGSPFSSTTYLLLLAVVMVDAADMSLVPAVFFEISTEFGVGPATLGTVTLCRGLAQSLVALAAGPLGNRFSRIKITGAGCILWAVATAMVGSSTSAAQLVVARSINGLGLGLVIPISYSLVSDLFPASSRGRAFGILQASSKFGTS